ncbi:histidine decarboxylase [Nocardia iowensis]
MLCHLNDLVSDLHAERPYMLGFPVNLDFTFSRLAGLLDVFADNGSYRDDEPDAMERAVVDFMARLANGSPDGVGGYVANNGSEANRFGLDRGCTLLPDAKIYCSEAAHRSIEMCARLMRKKLVVLACDRRGRIDTNALARQCWRDAGHGCVVVANIGTWKTGAIDDVEAIVAAASPTGSVYVHVDASLGGLLMPFTTSQETWGFAVDEVGSVAVSMHQGLGLPMPCAVALGRSDLVAAESVSGGACSGFASVMLWHALASKGEAGLALNASKAFDMAQYAAKKLADVGLRPVLYPDSITVVFTQPADWICRKYHLATEYGRARIITLPHVSKRVIDELCGDVVRNRRFFKGRWANRSNAPGNNGR